MFRKVTIFLFFLILFFQQISGAEKVWQEQNTGIRDLDIRSISVFGQDARFILAASSKLVYFSQNSGELWSKIFSLQGQDDEINFVTFDYSNAKILYLATTEGLYSTKNQGQDWQRIFSRAREAANSVGWITLDFLDSRKIYLGTKEGLYISQDFGMSWREAGGGLPHSQVSSVAVHPANSQVLYLANTYGLFKSIDSGQTWKRVYVTSHKISDNENEEDEEESAQIGEQQSLINCVAIDQYNPKTIFIATGVGVFISQDAGESWHKLTSRGLTSDDVNFIVVSADKKNAVYAATRNGVFEFLPDLDTWQELHRGMTAGDVRSLALNRKTEHLWAGTDRGVFKTVNIKFAQLPREEKKAKADSEVQIDFGRLLKELSHNEPSIQEVQEAALKYGEVIHPDQIRALRRGARLKALLPDVSLDYDKTIKDGGTTSNFGKFIIGPRDWGLSLSWDVGDLVFSEQVRLIDSNARLAVQLRDDILNEVTRLYYERRRLQTELLLTTAQTPEDNLTKLLRIEELTANIDALTGGYFSRNLQRGEEGR